MSSADRAIQPNFDRVARLYRWAEFLLLGPLLTRTREHFLPDLSLCRNALVLGDGDGRFTRALLQHQPHMQVIAVDISKRMLDLLQSRCIQAGVAQRLRTIQASALDLSSTTLPTVDLIVTHFMLDCLTQSEVDRLVFGLGTQVAPGCLWLVSDFAVPRRQPWRSLARLYIAGLYRAFGLLTGLRVRRLPDPESPLARAGFTRLKRSERLRGLLYSEFWRRSERS